jgi:hypothetical protein
MAILGQDFFKFTGDTYKIKVSVENATKDLSSYQAYWAIANSPGTSPVLVKTTAGDFSEEGGIAWTSTDMMEISISELDTLSLTSSVYYHELVIKDPVTGKSNVISVGDLDLKRSLFTNLYFENYDIDYQAVLNYAISNGFSIPSIYCRFFENRLMIDLKSSGAFSKMVYFRNYRGDGDLNYKCINWKTPGTYNATPVGQIVVNNNLGFSSNGSSYLLTGISQTDDVLTDRRLGFIGAYNSDLTGSSSNFSSIIGAQISFSINPFNYNGNPLGFFNGLENATGGIVLSSGRRSGVHILHRNIDTDYTWWINGTKAGENTTYGSATRYFARDLLELASNTSSTIGSPTPAGFFQEPVALTFLGNQALTDTEKINLSTTITNYMSNVLN